MTNDAEELIEFMPRSELVFLGPYDVESHSSLHMENRTSQNLAFKFKLTIPNAYYVSPVRGVIGPKGEANVSIVLRPTTEAVLEQTGHLQKFLVQIAKLKQPTNKTLNLVEFFQQLSSNDIFVKKIPARFVLSRNPLATFDPPIQPNSLALHLNYHIGVANETTETSPAYINPKTIKTAVTYNRNVSQQQQQQTQTTAPSPVVCSFFQCKYALMFTSLAVIFVAFLLTIYLKSVSVSDTQ